MSDKKKLLVVIDPGHTGNTYNAGAVSGEVSQKQAQNGHLEYPKVTDHSLSGCRLYRQRINWVKITIVSRLLCMT